jgi:4-amino-4-deoxy-L-arabinose transferase-like glycosyltransferase
MIPGTVWADRKRLIAGGVLLCFCFIIALERWHTYDEPFERDITTYAVIAHEMLQGRPLYSDMWDLKPPAVFVTYVVGEVLAGYGAASIYLLGVSAAIFTLLGIYRAGAIYGGRRCGLSAALLWTIVCSDLYLLANQPNSEVFINACLVWGFAGFLRLQTKNLDGWRVAMLGVLFAIASLYKQVTLAVFVMLALTHILCANKKTLEANLQRIAISQVLTLLLLIAAAWSGVIEYFALTNRGEVLYQTLVVIGGMYAGSISQNLLNGLAHVNLWPWQLYFATPLVLLSLTGLFIASREVKTRRFWLLWTAFIFGTEFAVSLPGKFQPHYYQLLLPPLVIGCAWGVHSLQNLKQGMFKHLALSLGVLACCFLLVREVPFFFLSSEEWSRRKYHGGFFIQERALAHEVDALLQKDETFYEYGREAGLYFHSKRHPPCGIIAGPTYNIFAKREITQLEQTQPEMLVVCTAYPLDSPVISWLMPRYTIFPHHHERGKFILLVRRGGKLEKRLNAHLQHQFTRPR